MVTACIRNAQDLGLHRVGKDLSQVQGVWGGRARVVKGVGVESGMHERLS